MLKGLAPVEGRPGEDMEPLDFHKLKEDLVAQWGEHITDQDCLSAALYPDVFRDYMEFRRDYGPVDKLDTRTFLVGPDIADEIEVGVGQDLSHLTTCISGNYYFICNSK